MKTIGYRFESLKSRIKQKRIEKFIYLLLLTLLFDKGAFAQQTAAASGNHTLSYWLLASLAMIFFGCSIYVLRTALKILHENGATVEYNFPMFKSMAQNSKTVSIIILLIVLTGIIWAVKFGG